MLCGIKPSSAFPHWGHKNDQRSFLEDGGGVDISGVDISGDL